MILIGDITDLQLIEVIIMTILTIYIFWASQDCIKQTMSDWLSWLRVSLQHTNHQPLTTHLTGATPRHWGTPEPWNERPLEWKVFAMLAVQNAGISFPSIQGARSLAGTSGDAPRHRHVAVHAVARTTRSHTGPSLPMPEVPRNMEDVHFGDPEVTTISIWLLMDHVK